MASYPRNWPPPVQIVAVLAIIGLMAAILFPVFQKVHTRGGPYSICRSDMKELGLALIQYNQDNDGRFLSGVNAAGNGWAGEIYPFVKSAYIYHCPDDAQSGKFISYAGNQNLAGAGFADLAQPAATVELYEFSTWNCDPSQHEAVSATGTSAPQDSTRHDSQSLALNFLLADGHVRWLMPGQVSGGIGAVSPKKLPPGALVKTFAVK